MTNSLRLQNIIYTNAMDESVAFYEALGLVRSAAEINQWWNEFALGDASLALHWNDGKPLPLQSNPELHFLIPATGFDSLYDAVATLAPSEVQTLRGLGRFFALTDPNGVRVQINEVV